MKRYIYIGIVGLGLSVLIILKFNVTNKENISSDPIKDGYIPNEQTAIKIAEAIWLPIYGEDMVEDEKPFKAKLIGDSVWVIEGTLGDLKDGGALYAKFKKTDSQIIEVTHFK